METQQRTHAADLCGMAALGYPVILYGTRVLLTLLLQTKVKGATLENPLCLTEAQTIFLQMIPGLLALAVPGIVVALVGRLSPQQMRWRKAPAGAVWRWMPFFLGVVTVAELLGGLLSKLLRLPRAHTMLPQSGAGMVLCYAAVCLLPAIGEELFFRGVLQGLLRPMGRTASIWGTAVLFSLLHGSLPQCIAALAAGLVLGLCTQTTGSLVPAILLHLTHNSIAFAGLWLEQYGLGGVFHFGLMVLLPLWGLFSLHRLPRRRRRPGVGPMLPQSAGYRLAAAGLAVLCTVRSFGLL